MESQVLEGSAPNLLNVNSLAGAQRTVLQYSYCLYTSWGCIKHTIKPATQRRCWGNSVKLYPIEDSKRTPAGRDMVIYGNTSLRARLHLGRQRKVASPRKITFSKESKIENPLTQFK